MKSEKDKIIENYRKVTLTRKAIYDLKNLLKDSNFNESRYTEIDKFVDSLDLNTVLKSTIEFNNLNLLKYLDNRYKQKPPDIIYYACEKNALDIVKWLVEGKNINVNTNFNHANSLLYTTIENKYVQLTKFLIEKGVDVNKEGFLGYSPLHIAVKNDDLELSELLITKGASIDQRDAWGEKPIHYAAEKNNVYIIKLLIESGTNPFDRLGFPTDGPEINRCIYDKKTALEIFAIEAIENPFVQEVLSLIQGNTDEQTDLSNNSTIIESIGSFFNWFWE